MKKITKTAVLAVVAVMLILTSIPAVSFAGGWGHRGGGCDNYNPWDNNGGGRGYYRGGHHGNNNDLYIIGGLAAAVTTLVVVDAIANSPKQVVTQQEICYEWMTDSRGQERKVQVPCE